MSAKIKYIESLIKEGKHTIALSELIALRDTVEKGSIEYSIETIRFFILLLCRIYNLNGLLEIRS